MKDTVIFDLDGTLLDTLPGLAAAGNAMLTGMGFPGYEVDEYRMFVGGGIPNLVEKLLPKNYSDEVFWESLTRFNREYGENLFTDVAPYAGIPELIAELKQRNITCAVVSNKRHDYTVQLVDKFFPGVMACVTGAGEYPLKPDPASTNAIIAQLAAKKENVLYAGDSGVDMKTARNVGVTSCGVTWGFRSPEELLKAGAEHLIDRPDELLKLL